MSNALAIAAVTATLRDLLVLLLAQDTSQPPVEVTLLPPDLARRNHTKEQVNLFLYQVAPDAAWRNMDLPRQLKPGETGFPPLPLTLFYLLTGYSEEDQDDIQGQRALGRAMSVLHDHPLLDAAFIQEATSTSVPGADLHEQAERVRITLKPESSEELSKLWTSFGTSFRASAAYEASVVLIESTRPAKAPLPVLKRGKDDTGVASQPDVASPFPALFAVTPADGQPSAQLGEIVTLTGSHLDAGAVAVRLSHPLLQVPPPITVLPGGSATQIQFRLDEQPALWVAGFYTVSVVLTQGSDVRGTNELPLTLAPRITSAPLPLDVKRTLNPNHPDHESAKIIVNFRPQYRPGQRAVLLVGDREVPAEPLPPPVPPETEPASTDTLTFILLKAPVAQPYVRLRIDGVDSLLVQRPPGQPPQFDADQSVNIHD